MAICYAVERTVARQQHPTPEGLKVADAFKALRDKADLTQEEVARRVGLTLSGYRPYEQGKRQLRIEQLPTFAGAFEVSVETLSARLGLHDVTIREIRVAECADIMEQLADEPPEIAATILGMFRESIRLARMRPRSN